MKKAILLLLCLGSVSCITQSHCDKGNMTPKFNYGDRVTVTNGFFKGKSGFVIEETSDYIKGCDFIAYKIQIDYNVDYNRGEVSPIIVSGNLQKEK